jgi:acid phosphatase family membrane protein YuiD
MKKLLLIVLLMSTSLFAQVKGGITVPYIDFPMKEGKGMYSTRGKCNMCHSWGYTINQGLQSKKFWRAKVMKMIVVFKAPIRTQKDIDTVVNYLFENYGNGELE